MNGDPFTNILLHIYCWVCLERIFELSRYLAKLSIDCLKRHVRRALPCGKMNLL